MNGLPIGFGRLLVALVLGSWSLGPQGEGVARAACNVIPQRSNVFRSTVGTIDRPFASPGDWVTLGATSACDTQSTSSFPGTARDQVVTVAFRPPNGASNIVVLAASCGEVDLASCRAVPGVATATCITAEVDAPPFSLEHVSDQKLRFRFPDTDSVFLGAADGRTFTGPVAIAVTRAGDPLPCGLARADCASQGGTLACIDTLLARDGTCAATPHRVFPGFTALPPPNDYQALCSTPSPPCTGLADELRFTIDQAGNLLLPLDYLGVLVRRDKIPVPRLLKASSEIEAFEGAGIPIRILDPSSLGSYTVDGSALPPIFDAQADPTALGALSLFGSSDAPRAVVRIARHRSPLAQCAGGSRAAMPCAGPADCPGGDCAAPVCHGGSASGTSCSADLDCPGGECGAALFDFSTRLAGEVGPVVLRRDTCLGGTNELASCSTSAECDGGQCATFVAAALDPVPLDGLRQTDQMNAFVAEEGIENRDLNGDGDTTDSVLTLQDRQTGVVATLPAPPSCPLAPDRGSVAVARTGTRPFLQPALDADQDVVALLESESAEGYCDINGDGDRADAILRILRRDGTDVAAALSPPPAVDPAARIDGRSVALSGGKVFYRRSEAAEAAQVTASPREPNFSRALPAYFASALSQDGRFISYWSGSEGPNDTNGQADVYVYDRLSSTQELVTVNRDGVAPSTYHGSRNFEPPWISTDGRFVCFSSAAPDLIADDGNGALDVFVRDRLLGTTERVSLSAGGGEGNSYSYGCAMTPDGRFVAFGSAASNLVDGDTNGGFDYFVRDRVLGRTERVNVATDGSQRLDSMSDLGEYLSISSDGRFVAFADRAYDRAPLAPSGTAILVRDRALGTLEAVDTPALDGTASGCCNSWSPILSADGRFVAYLSDRSDLVPGDTNGLIDIFVTDRETGQIERISVATGETQANRRAPADLAARLFFAMSPDARFVVWSSDASNLVPGDTNSRSDIFLRDRASNQTQRISVCTDGSETQSSNEFPIDLNDYPSISGDGRTIAWWTQADRCPGLSPGLMLRGPQIAEAPSALFPNGVGDDTVLETLDIASGGVQTLCPAGDVAVAGGKATFLRPEATSGTTACPGGSLNADADTSDEIVQCWPGTGPVVNLGQSATSVAMSESWIGATVTDTGASAPVAQFHRICAGSWVDTGMATTRIAVSGDTAAFLASEAPQGSSLNNGPPPSGDLDLDDQVLQVYQLDAGSHVNVGQAAEEFVLGDGGLVAFRTSELAQGHTDLNDDGDVSDGVLQVFDVAAGALLNTKQAVTPCTLEACDPRVPYRVLHDTIRFLTFEGDQGVDLNGNGRTDELILQVLNVREACHTGDMAASCHVLAATPIGVCTTTGEACVRDSTCGEGRCFIPPGGCVLDLTTSCDPRAAVSCPAGQFCKPVLGLPAGGTCMMVEGPCSQQSDCSDPAVCFEGSQAFNRLADPLSANLASSMAFTGVGHCVERFGSSCARDDECAAGEHCLDGSCGREHGICAADSECPAGAACERDLIRISLRDSDGDELPDEFDNCPDVPNVMQTDGDGDGVGDECDAPPCSDSDHDRICDDLDPCTSVDQASQFDPSLRPWLRLSTSSANDPDTKGTLRASGHFGLPSSVELSDLDLATTGGRILVLDSSSRPLWTGEFSPGAFSSEGRSGWRRGRNGRSWHYLARPLAGAGTPRVNLQLSEVSVGASRRVKARIAVRGPLGITGGVGSSPVNLVVVLGGAAQAVSGMCGESAFAAGDCHRAAGGRRIACAL